MADLAIRSEGLGKCYQLGGLQPYRTLRESLARAVRGPWRQRDAQGSDDDASLWALRDVDLEVERGEVLGVIGRNGGGKSTLLRLLARITEPSEGRAAVRGRVGSLLEVGTGFHPELTGRENVYLNGALLGMTRAETRSRFDEIVAFAEVERFLDTPVKRYSTGMRMRLGFAVAAHLDPDVLLVDEVLAVGDAGFQSKCMGKMSDEAREGRTVIFVSHDMNAVASLCSRVVMLDGGRIAAEGSPREVIGTYLERSRATLDGLEQAPGSWDLSGASRDGVEYQGREVLIQAARVRDGAGEPASAVEAGDALTVEVDYEAQEPLARPYLSIILSRPEVGRVAMLHTLYQHGPLDELPAAGTLRCSVPRLPLVPGSYTLSFGLSIGGDTIDWVEHCVPLEVLPGDFYGTGLTPKASLGLVMFDAHWDFPDRSRR